LREYRGEVPGCPGGVGAYGQEVLEEAVVVAEAEEQLQLRRILHLQAMTMSRLYWKIARAESGLQLLQPHIVDKFRILSSSNLVLLLTPTKRNQPGSREMLQRVE